MKNFIITLMIANGILLVFLLLIREKLINFSSKYWTHFEFNPKEEYYYWGNNKPLTLEEIETTRELKKDKGFKVYDLWVLFMFAFFIHNVISPYHPLAILWGAIAFILVICDALFSVGR